MKSFSALLAATVVASLIGCTNMKVSSERIGDYSFASIHTYIWAQAPEKILNEEDTYLNDSMKEALNNEFLERNWKQGPSTDNADIKVIYYIKLQEHQEYASASEEDEPRLTGGFTFGKEKGAWSQNQQQNDLTTYTVETGVLTLLIYDTKTDRCIWKGTLKTRLDRSSSIEKQQEKFKEIARKISQEIP